MEYLYANKKVNNVTETKVNMSSVTLKSNEMQRDGQIAKLEITTMSPNN